MNDANMRVLPRPQERAMPANRSLNTARFRSRPWAAPTEALAWTMNDANMRELPRP